MSDETPKPNRTRQKKAKSRERILQEAASAIRMESADRVSVATIMGRAGMTVGGFYAHFASKDELLAMAVRHMFEERYSAFLSRLDHPDATHVLSQFLDTYLSMRHRDAVERGCPIPALAGEIGRLAPPVRDEFTQGIDRLVAGVNQLLVRMGREDADDLSASLIAEMTGALALSRAQPVMEKAEAMLSASRSLVRHRVGLQ
ncbi:TetR/AcrR family transcriptional regulator [Sphingomonas glacialis]|nr:TetR/AcrR family transcriptional regulator [Sphingomonas glacialis]